MNQLSFHYLSHHSIFYRRGDEIEMSAASPVHEIGPGEGYDIDSDEYDSEEEMDQLNPGEYDRLVEEGQFILFSSSVDTNSIRKADLW